MPKEYAEWRVSNGQPYLEVAGEDPYTIGLVQGVRLADQIHHLKHYVEDFAVRYAVKRQTYKKFRELARMYEKFFLPHFIEEMKGFADGAKEVDYEDILLQNCFFDIVYGQLIPEDIENPLLSNFALGCTAFGIMNSHRSDKEPYPEHQSGENSMPKPLIGQNFDYAKIFGRALSFVYMKKPNKPEVFALRLGSMLCLPAGRNSLGVAITVNAIKSRVQGALTMPVTAKARLCLETSVTAESCYDLIFSMPATAPCNLLIADNAEIIAIEALPEHHVKRNVSTIIVKSNTFVTDRLQQFLTHPKYSKQRQYYAAGRLAQLYEDKGGVLTDDDLLELLRDKPIICRNKRLQPKTIAFLTRKYFGSGNPVDNPIGLIPF